MADLENLVKTTLSELREIGNAQSVVGDPVEIGETTIIPLVKIGFGFGGGGEEGKNSERSGGGGGGGVQPVAVLYVTNGVVRLERMTEQSGFSSATNTVADFMKTVISRWMKARKDRP